MKIDNLDDTRYNVKIAPFDDKPNFRIVELRKPHTAYDGEHENDAMISWSAIGDVTPDEAEMFANAILEAVKLGRRMDAEHDPAESAKKERAKLDEYERLRNERLAAEHAT